ncbi:hypothetical protein [uncultured Cetobacterium sp.]|uniref:hypothetical protein n=1 Tax=uncultured Cetobacterium sp. TaxID=527638 RepID=UPI0026280F8C|nr:hypothetical protein [uncultured Cetobacterium sp.]
MDLKDIIKFIGSLAFTSAILTVTVFILNYKYKEFLNKILNGKLSHIQLHKILGITTIILGTIHGLSMAFAYPLVLKKYTGISGILLLSLFWILGTLPFIMKKVPIKYKKITLKSHKILGGIIFIFILIHISL